MTEQEFPAEVIEAAVLSNIGYYSVGEFREAHKQIVMFMEDISKDGMISLKRFEFLMNNVLLTLVHARDYMKLVTEKATEPLYGDAEKDKWLAFKPQLLAIAKDDERIKRLAYFVNEGLEDYEERAAKEDAERAEKVVKAFEDILKSSNLKGNDETSTD